MIFPVVLIQFDEIVDCGITTDGARTLHRIIRKTSGMMDVLFRGMVEGIVFNVDNQINGEGVGYIFSAKYWESFTINSKMNRANLNNC